MSPSATDQSAAHPAKLDGAFFERLFEGAGLAIFACDRDGRIVAWNSRGEQLFRGRGECRGGVDLRDVLPDSDRAMFDQQLVRLRDTLESVEFRTRFAVGDALGREYTVWMTPMLESDGRIGGVNVWFHDVTLHADRHRAALKNHRLEALGAMSGSVAHHYNNLLCGVATSLEYAMNMSTLMATRKALGRAADTVSRAATLTRQLLAFAQADYRSADMADLTEMVTYYVDENEAAWQARGVSTVLDWSPVPSIELPREQFNLVLANVCGNALDAMPSGGTLTVRLASVSADVVRVTVSDTGPGISPEHMERLFEPFFTTKGELAEGTQQRTGMGLAVVHGLIGEMRGTVTAHNNAGGGARIEITLPTR